MEISATTSISTPRAHVWDLVTQFDVMSNYHPYIEKTSYIHNESQHIGTQFQCDFGKGRYIIEEIVQWQPEMLVAFSNVSGHKMPRFKESVTTFQLEEISDQQTKVIMSVTYKLAGLLGPLLDKTFLKKQYETYLPNILKGLKAHCEQQQ